MKKTGKIYAAAGFCFLLPFINELGLLIDYARMYRMLVMTAGVRQVTQDLVPSLLMRAAFMLCCLLLMVYCFFFSRRKAGAWLSAGAFMMEMCCCIHFLWQNILFLQQKGAAAGTETIISTAAQVPMIAFCLLMILFRPLRHKGIWTAAGVMLGLYILPETGLMIAECAAFAASRTHTVTEWLIRSSVWVLSLCRLAGYGLVWLSDRNGLLKETPASEQG